MTPERWQELYHMTEDASGHVYNHKRGLREALDALYTAKAAGAREALELLADWADHAPILLTSVAVAVEARARIARPVHAAEDCALPGEPPR